MSASELEKLHSILKNSTNPRQRAMVENLIKKVNEQQAKPIEADTPNADTTESQPQTAEVLTTTSPEDKPKTTPEFKAVGVVTGEVNLSKDSAYSITINGKTYRLKYASEKQKSLWALKKEIEATGRNLQRLIVYPRMTHFPGRDQPPVLHFEVVGFEGHAVRNKGIINDLKDFEFKLSGLWQFIPVCRVPCISIFKNFSEERKLFVKEAEPYVRVRFMRANHIPLGWRDSPVKPFRFNPKLPKDQDQGRPMFVQVKARFIPGRDQFEFIEQLAEPLAESPRFMKASKEDKIEQRKNAPPTTQNPIKKEPAITKPKLARPIKSSSSAI